MNDTMNAVNWARLAGKAEGERKAIVSAVQLALETMDEDPGLTKIILESILLAVEDREVANDTPTI